MILKKIVITNFREKLRQLSLMFFFKIQMMKNIQKSLKLAKFEILAKIWDPDNVEVKQLRGPYIWFGTFIWKIWSRVINEVDDGEERANQKSRFVKTRKAATHPHFPSLQKSNFYQ